jgi:hypothetical protein
MVKVICALLGEDSTISVDIQMNELVTDLKEAIKEKKPNRIRCDADDLTLFTTRRDGRTRNSFVWLDDDEEGDLGQLSKTPISPQMRQKYLGKKFKLKSSWALKNYFDTRDPQEKVIHVLVDLGRQDSTAVSIADPTSYHRMGDERKEDNKNKYESNLYLHTQLFALFSHY